MIPGRPGDVNRFSSVANPACGRRHAARTRYDAAMPLRVAMLAAECEPWAKTGGLADVVDALARALGQLPAATRRDAGRRLPAALPRRAGARPARRADDGRCASRIRGRRRAAARSTDPRRRRPTATGCASSTTRPPSIATGFYGDAAGDYADNAWRFGLFCRAALEALRADGRPVDVLHLHDWHTGPGGDLPRRRATPTTRSSAGGDRSSRSTTSPTTAGRRGRPLGQLGLRAGRRRRRGRTPTASTCCATASSAPSSSTRSRPGSPREALTPAFGMGLDGALRAKGDRFVGILNGLDTDGLGSGDRRRPRRAVLARPTARGKAACRARPPDAARLRPGRRRRRARDDRPARSAEGLRPAGRRRRRTLLDARRPARRPGERPPGARRPVPGARRGAPRPGRAHRALRPGDGPPDLRRRRLLPDAVAVRAVRPGPDDRAALRDAADRPPDRRPGRHGHRRDDAPGRRHRASSSRRRPPTALLAACERGDGAAGGRRPAVGGAARSRDGGRLRLGTRARRRATSRRTGGRSRSGAEARGRTRRRTARSA